MIPNRLIALQFLGYIFNRSQKMCHEKWRNAGLEGTTKKSSHTSRRRAGLAWFASPESLIKYS